MAGFKVVAVKALGDGSLDLEDLASKAKQHKDKLAAFMVSPKDRLGIRTLLIRIADYLPVHFRCVRRWCARCERIRGIPSSSSLTVFFPGLQNHP